MKLLYNLGVAGTKETSLFWIEIETTGLNADTDAVLEVACVVTDVDLNLIAKGLDLVVHQADEILLKMPDSVRSIHSTTGLLEKVKNSKLTFTQVEDEVVKFVTEYCGFKTSPFCGNTVGFDKEIVRKQMPRLFRYMHYRTIDVTSIAELCKRWYPRIELYKKRKGESALDDVLDSIEELRYYRERIFCTP